MLIQMYSISIIYFECICLTWFYTTLYVKINYQ